MFSIRHTIVSMGIAAALAVVATAPVYASETNAISIVKNCATWGTTATCVVTSSRPLGFLSGAVITYGGGPGGHPFDLFGATGTDVQIVTDSPSGAAPGFCHMNPAIGLGHCTFSSGTGKLNGFSADLVVRSLGSGNWSLIGSYSYRSDED
ncbi:MAG TPA: hypothetical protein VEU77_12195 [Candidatus Acidoferrales bacterium]|nr:hypothetical protein [Candidatus Acidoferrales bacterium]